MLILISNIILISAASATYTPDSNSLNVGSVLFSRNNLNKSLWYNYEIQLLKARKYFQSLLPAPHDIKTINENSLDHIMTYFNDSYVTIKREARSRPLQNIMDVALSDVFGGYLKEWILPITKYAYYGGSVSMEKAVSTFQVYDKIKSNLETDGHSWRSPNVNLLRSVTIDVISRPRTTFTRSMGDPCKPLAYYEKADTDFKIPMPILNWNIQPPSLVLPFKNNSCLHLSSPDSSHILLQYFDIAENCMKSQNMQKLDEFNERFQIWLASDVVPHLNDDCLYIAFGNILSLVNKTKQLGRLIYKSYNEKYEKLKCKASAMKSKSQLLLKKYFIIGIILLIEIIWCVPSVYFIMRLKRKNRFQRARECFCRFFKKRKPAYSVHHYSQYSCEDTGFQRFGSGIRMFFKRNEKNLEVDRFSFHDSELLFKNNEMQYNDTSHEKINLVNEVPKKSSSRKRNKIACISAAQETVNVNNKPKISQGLISTSILKKQSQESKSLSGHKTSVLNEEQTIKEINYSQVPSVKVSNTALKCICCMENENISKDPQLPCPCLTCIATKNVEDKPLIDKKLKPRYFRFKQNDNKKKGKPITTLHGNPKGGLQTKINKNIRTSEGPHLHIHTNAKKAAEVQEEIKSIEETAGSSRKPSKIPRLKIKSGLNVTDKYKNEQSSPKPPNEKVTRTLRKNSLKINNKVLDDTAIKRTSVLTEKLNASL